MKLFIILSVLCTTFCVDVSYGMGCLDLALDQKGRPGTHKRKFTLEEDALLRNLVAQSHDLDWGRIASQIPGRNTRQCRERWNNYLAPSLTKWPWTEEEESFLLLKFFELGPKWIQIACFFPDRSRNQIKNQFQYLMRKQNTWSSKGKRISIEETRIPIEENSPSEWVFSNDDDTDLGDLSFDMETRTHRSRDE
ncbi:MAG: hypothetical protein LBF76_01500 [Holosporales bacterium]|nr:hypothetical protein [Holosporales bacterium]